MTLLSLFSTLISIYKSVNFDDNPQIKTSAKIWIKIDFPMSLFSTLIYFYKSVNFEVSPQTKIIDNCMNNEKAGKSIFIIKI